MPEDFAKDRRPQMLCEMEAIVRCIRMRPSLRDRDECGRKLQPLVRTAPMSRLLSREDFEFVRRNHRGPAYLACYKAHRAWIFYCYLFHFMVDFQRRRNKRLAVRGKHDQKRRLSLQQAAKDELALIIHACKLIYAATVWAIPLFHFQNDYCERLAISSIDAIQSLGRCPVVAIRPA